MKQTKQQVSQETIRQIKDDREKGGLWLGMIAKKYHMTVQEVVEILEDK